MIAFQRHAGFRTTYPMSEFRKFAERKRLPIDFLIRHGVTEDANGIRFSNATARPRIRGHADSHKTIWAGDATGVLRVYGYDRVELMAKQSRSLLVCEGESDALTAWLHERPAVGVPGSSMHELLKYEDVALFDRVLVVREPDEAGRKFSINVPTRLRHAGYSGSIVVVNLLVKDLSDLHVKHADNEIAFEHSLDTAIEESKPVDLPAQSDRKERVREVHLVSASAIEPMETDYIVRPYIPRGEATWLEGPTKAGKTMIALDIIARISTGKAFVNGERIARGNVAIMTCEDDAARTLVPRLIAAGADLERVSFVHVSEGEQIMQIQFIADLHAIEERLIAANVSLVFLDGTFGLLGVKDAASYIEAYEKMLPFVAMIRRLNAGALIVRHVRKSAGSALDKGIGSVGFGALARSTLAVAIDRDDDSQRVFAHAGCNVGPVGPSYAFTIEETEINGFAYPVGRAVWGEQVEISADEAVAPRNVDESGLRSEAEEFLLEFLDDQKTGSAIQAEATRRGLSFRTVQRAAKRLGVAIQRRGFGEGSLWIPPVKPICDTNPHLRQDSTAVANVANPSRMGVLSDSGKICCECAKIGLAYAISGGNWLCKRCSEAA